MAFGSRPARSAGGALGQHRPQAPTGLGSGALHRRQSFRLEAWQPVQGIVAATMSSRSRVLRPCTSLPSSSRRAKRRMSLSLAGR